MIWLTVLIAAGLVTSTMGCAKPAGGGRVIVLGIDGLDPVTMDMLLAEGKLPNFARLRREGAYGRLQSMQPMLSPIIWTTVATGKPPSEHKIGHFVATNQSGDEVPVTSRMRKVRAIWNIMSSAGKEVGIVGWWATWPAETVRGTVVSDHTCYHFLFEEGGGGAQDLTGVVSPPEATNDILKLVRRPASLSSKEIQSYIDVPAEALLAPFRFDDDLSQFKWALATAQSYSDIGAHLWKTRHPDLLMVYIEGVDSTSHLFGHLFRMQGLSGELAEQHKHYGMAVEHMYELADRIVGRYLEMMDDETTLVVLSDHGFQLGQLHDDPSKTHDMRRVSEYFHRIEGVLYLYGKKVVPKAHIEGAGILDVTPTLLALAGLAPAADMPGSVVEQVLRPSSPMPRVPSYENESLVAQASGPVSGADAVPDTAVDPQILERLRTLGYLDTASPASEKNLASMHFEQGLFAEAAEAYRKLLIAEPDDAALQASLAAALGALGDYDGALAALAEAEKLSPLNPEIHHNRGVIEERRNRPLEAVDHYRRALRYNPHYKPSSNALARLTGSADPSAPRTDAEKRAALLADGAGLSARRGDYASAMTALEEAERIAPDYALVQQYRANVLFLKGDRQGAIAALEKALAIEPDNAMFARNLRSLTAPQTPP